MSENTIDILNQLSQDVRSVADRAWQIAIGTTAKTDEERLLLGALLSGAAETERLVREAIREAERC